MRTINSDHAPVVIGVAQETWRDPDRGRTPHEALEQVARAALADCGSSRVLPAIDALAHVPYLLEQEPNLAPLMPRGSGSELARRLGIRPVQYTGVTGGNLPQEFVNRLASALYRGEHRVAMICGAELLNTLFCAFRAGESAPDWSLQRSPPAQCLSRELQAYTAGSEFAHGVREPIVAYPLFETALRHAEGRDVETHQRRLGALVSRMSEVARENPRAWRRQRWSPEEVLSTDGGNRLISYPYTRVMNAVASVDMAASAILTTAGVARELGVPAERMVYLAGSADAQEHWCLSERAELHASPALSWAGEQVLQQSGLGIDEIERFDLYSCFPSAVQVACNSLGLALDDPRGVTVTGGLTLFGGPGNNYSLHAICELVELLRSGAAATGLVTANGGYLTKHSVGVYTAGTPRLPWVPFDQAQPQHDIAAPLELAARGEGELRIEAYTVCHDHNGPVSGVVLGRLEDGRRCLALSEESQEILKLLMSQECVGRSGRVTAEGEINRFRF